MRTIRFLAVAIGSVALAYIAGAQAFETWGSRFMTDAVLKLDSRSAGALAMQSERAWEDKDKSRFQKIAKANSLNALRSEPLSYRAVRQLGLYYNAAGNPAKARELIDLSTKLTRRDGLGQLWLAEDYARRGRLNESLRAFDIVIRIQPDAREVAYRAMGAALADTEFRNAFVTLARRGPPWLPSFLAYNVGESARPADIAAIVRALQPLPPSVLPAKETGALLSRLVDSAPIDDARLLYLSLPMARRERLTSLAFSSPRDVLLYPPFGWEVFDNTGVEAFGGSDGKSATIEATVMPGYRGTAARKLLFLPAGSYDWSGTTDLTQMAPEATAKIVLSCYSAPGKWARSGEFPLRNGANRFAISVPGKCPAQLLSIELVGADNQADSSMTLGSMALAGAKAN